MKVVKGRQEGHGRKEDDERKLVGMCVGRIEKRGEAVLSSYVWKGCKFTCREACMCKGWKEGGRGREGDTNINHHVHACRKGGGDGTGINISICQRIYLFVYIFYIYRLSCMHIHMPFRERALDVAMFSLHDGKRPVSKMPPVEREEGRKGGWMEGRKGRRCKGRVKGKKKEERDDGRKGRGSKGRKDDAKEERQEGTSRERTDGREDG
jgi:hypothetical protein